MPMRRLLLTLLCGLAVVPTALAAAHATGDGVLELKAVYGTVQIGTITQPAQGALWGQMDSGKLKVIDPVANDGPIFVSGYDKHWPLTNDAGVKIGVGYSGQNLHLRITGGKYKLWFQGSGIDLTAVGVGKAYLSGDPSADDAGDYAVNGGKWIAVPVIVPSTALPKTVPFGDQLSTP
jgi:hypothetical protein